MTLKEDYDFTAQHLHTYGQIARLNRVFVKAKHYTNAGGAVAVRNDEREQYNIKILRRKWPGVFRAHPFRGPNEVRMYVIYSEILEVIHALQEINPNEYQRSEDTNIFLLESQVLELKGILRFEETWSKRTATSSCERIQYVCSTKT